MYSFTVQDRPFLRLMSASPVMPSRPTRLAKNARGRAGAAAVPTHDPVPQFVPGKQLHAWPDEQEHVMMPPHPSDTDPQMP
jgi:hypothetical protein